MPPDRKIVATDLPARDVLPWMRQNHETGKAFEAFAVYRDLGPSRSITGVEHHFDSIGRHRNRRLYERWSAEWAWVRRCVLYDQDVDRKKWEEEERKRTEMVDRHARAFQALFAKAMQRVVGTQDGSVRAIDMNEVGFRDLVTGVVELAKMERVTRGVPSEHTLVDGVASTVLVDQSTTVQIGMEQRKDQAASMLAVLARSGYLTLTPASTEPGVEVVEGEAVDDDD